MSDKDFYKILELNRNATTDDIKSAYRRLARKHHPDKNVGGAYDDQKFKDISEAYQVLSDEKERKKYDSGARSGFKKFKYRSPEDLFAEMFPEEAVYQKLFSGDLFQNFFSFPEFRGMVDNPYRNNYVNWWDCYGNNK